MSLTFEEVEHIALLARLGISAEELESYRSQLESILDNFKVIQEVDTDGVLPTGHSGSLENVLREDTPSQSLSREDLMANAPRRDGDYFRVRAVLE
jgi:aspartyl-tRNA(Asn)/glutamyl-tRNA(Gln) amidotransferase subunit C